MSKDESPKYTKYIVRVAVTNKPIFVTSSLQQASDFCAKNGKKRLWIDRKVIE